MNGYYGNGYIVCLKAGNFLSNSDFTIIIQIIQVKNTVENVAWNSSEDGRSNLVKIVITIHNKRSQADIALLRVRY